MSVLLSSVESGLSDRHREVNENYLHLTWGIVAGMGVNLAWNPKYSIAALISRADEFGRNQEMPP